MSDAKGIIYRRIDRNVPGEKPYIGQAESEELYLTRQRTHVRLNPGADFEFEIVDRGVPGADLDKREENWIRRAGGPSRKSTPDGGAQNKRSQMNPERYEKAGGNETDPTRP